MVCALLIALLLQDTPLDKAARAVADKIVAEPAEVESLFDKAFLDEIPADRLRALCRQLHAANGKVTSVVPVAKSPGKFTFSFEKGGTCTATVTLTDKPPQKIIGLWLGPVSKAAASTDEVVEELEKLPGTVSLKVVRLGDKPGVIAELNPDEPLAIGSACKLFILGTLVEDKRPWGDVVPLKGEWMSLPSGDLHTWPAGSPITIHSLAAKMISTSDNTATDHLLFIAGRERVEAMTKDMGVAKAERSQPFLSTLELFKLKGNADVLKKFITADEKARRGLLAGEVRDIPRDKVGTYSSPTAIDSVEWFASASDLCRTMDWFRRKNESTALSILAINPGIEVSKDAWSYVGFKGGSEPGVVHLTLLLKSTDGRSFAVSAGWNDPERAVDTMKLLGHVQSLVRLLEKAR